MKVLQNTGSILFLSGLLFLSGTGLSRGQETPEEEAREVVASGLGSITAGDVAHARDDAIEDALRKGIESTLGTILKAETLVENFQLIEDNIFSKTQGYVQTYEVIREQKRNEQLYEVTVKAMIKMADLKNDLEGIATIIRRKNTPRMMVMIEERNIGEAPGLFHYFDVDMNNAETAIIQAFMDKGFRFVDRQTVRQNLEREQAAAILEGDAAQAAALGRKVGAEVVLTGKALAKATVVEVYGAKQRSQQATVTARAIRSDTGDIIATASAQGAFPHIDDAVGSAKAIEKACAQLSEDLMEKVLDRWQADVSSGSSITLQVRGIADYAQLTKFKSALPYYVRGLTSVVQRDWDGGYATLEIVMAGNSDDLAQRLSGKDIEGIKVKVIGMTQNSVTVELESTVQ